MQITVEVPDELRRKAESRGLPIIDFVEILIARGLEADADRPLLRSAMERIRALRSEPPDLNR
jgi:hypothetical protein